MTKLSAKEEAALRRLPLSVKQWCRIHGNTRRALVRKGLVERDPFSDNIVRARSRS